MSIKKIARTGALQLSFSLSSLGSSAKEHNRFLSRTRGRSPKKNGCITRYATEEILRDVTLRDVIARATFERLGHDFVRRYSNEVTSFERPFQAQHNDPRYVFVARTKRKLRAFEILDIYAWMHYTYSHTCNACTYISNIHVYNNTYTYAYMYICIQTYTSHNHLLSVSYINTTLPSICTVLSKIVTALCIAYGLWCVISVKK